eukprot:GHVU01213481.1.p2 GENE.GHVU01213481.1~~GHVU01213481.1.p2  ORF type:complete len:297 (+),score=47.55 GHVU01213481.1:915-1805(+)
MGARRSPRGAGVRIPWRVRRPLERAVRRGKRKVLWTQQTANLGNFLYDWMHAFNYRAKGEDIVCLRTPKTEPWVPVFGALADELLVRREDVRLTDRREKSLYNEWGVGFDERDLDTFLEGFMKPSGVIDPDRVPAECRLGEKDVLVNVRRGDYVSNPANWQNYGFDVVDYLTVALERSREVGGDIGRILVVSDDSVWCQDHLGWLAEHGTHVDFETGGHSPASHLAILANAHRMILANSTFSYWGGYMSAWRYGRPEQVVAPWFHIRADLGGAAWQLDPRWSVIRDIPSGWSLPES